MPKGRFGILWENFEGTVRPSPWALAAGFGPYPRTSTAGRNLHHSTRTTDGASRFPPARFTFPGSASTDADARQAAPRAPTPKSNPSAPGTDYRGRCTFYLSVRPWGPAEFARLAPAIEIVTGDNRTPYA